MSIGYRGDNRSISGKDIHTSHTIFLRPMSTKMSLMGRKAEHNEDSLSASEDTVREPGYTDHPLRYSEMTKIAADIKSTFSSAITDLRADFLALSDWLSHTERAEATRDRAMGKLTATVSSHATHLMLMNRHLEDLDNRGRRQNNRVRGIPEKVEPAQIKQALQAVFIELLERPKETDIDFVKAHRALAARPADTAPPRDIICCLQSFPLKEEILNKARKNDQILFNDHNIALYQDLSHITLQNRRALRPMITALRDKGVPYPWRLPFALNATYLVKQYYSRMPEDIQAFCDQLQIPLIDLPEWYKEFRSPAQGVSPPHTPQSSPSKPSSTKKAKSDKYSGSDAGKSSYTAKGSRPREYT